MENRKEIISDDICDICGNKKPELVRLTKKGWVWNTKLNVCQTCISQIFRGFHKGT